MQIVVRSAPVGCSQAVPPIFATMLRTHKEATAVFEEPPRHLQNQIFLCKYRALGTLCVQKGLSQRAVRVCLSVSQAIFPLTIAPASTTTLFDCGDVGLEAFRVLICVLFVCECGLFHIYTVLCVRGQNFQSFTVYLKQRKGSMHDTQQMLRTGLFTMQWLVPLGSSWCLWKAFSSDQLWMLVSVYRNYLRHLQAEESMDQSSYSTWRIHRCVVTCKCTAFTIAWIHKNIRVRITAYRAVSFLYNCSSGPTKSMYILHHVIYVQFE